MNARVLPRVGMLVAPTIRSRAYVQTLAAQRLMPTVSVLMPSEEMQWQGPSQVALPCDQKLRVFAPGTPARRTIEQLEWPSVELPNADINNSSNFSTLRSLEIDVLIYSGMNKALVGHDALHAAPRLLHIHGGYLPAYRAATASYFGLLETGYLGVSALWLDEGVDTGDILARGWYPNIPGFDVDHVIEPLSRADLLVGVLEHYLSNGSFPSISAEDEESESFFVIHPVLKHLALKRQADLAPAR